MVHEKMIHDFEDYAEKTLKKYRVPGFSIGVACDGERVYEKGFGFRDREKELPLSSETVFGIGSITKSFTAMSILQLQEKGKLSVNDPVINHLPELKMPGGADTSQVTIHHFLTNSSGMPPLPTLFGALKRSMEKDREDDGESEQENPLEGLEAIDTHNELMEAIAKSDVAPLGGSGEEFSYSNEGFALLGAIIERISNESYEDYVTKNILKPAGMDHSSFFYDDLKVNDDSAVLYATKMEEGEEVTFRADNPWDAPPMRAAGFLKSTVNDMLRYMEIFRDDGKVGGTEILSPENVKAMMTPYIEVEHGTYYGYGLMIVPDFFGYKLIQHGGDIKGVTAHMNLIPELGITGIALTNLAGVPSSKLLNAVCQGFMDKPIDASHLKLGMVDLAPEALKEYEGTFVSGEGGQVKFFVENEALHFHTDGMPEGVLKPVGKDMFLFHMREMDFIIHFVRDENETIHRVSFGFRQIGKMPVEAEQANA